MHISHAANFSIHRRVKILLLLVSLYLILRQSILAHQLACYFFMIEAFPYSATKQSSIGAFHQKAFKLLAFKVFSRLWDTR